MIRSPAGLIPARRRKHVKRWRCCDDRAATGYSFRRGAVCRSGHGACRGGVGQRSKDGVNNPERIPGGTRLHHRQHRQKLLEDLRDREADVLRFATDTRIPPTSNQAERDLRPAKTQEKISGRLRSAATTRHRYAIRGYLSTATKHGTSALPALRDALTGTPWMPPIPSSL